MASENVIELTDDNYESTIKDSSEPVLIDFWAEWCGPCRRVGPIIDELATEYDGKVKICKVNIDEHQNAANQLGVRSIPTIALFKGGELVERMVGAQPKDILTEAIDKIL